MQSILTKYLGPGGKRGARMMARISSGARTIFRPYNHELTATGNHKAVAQELAALVDWPYRFIEGSLGKDGHSIFVIDDGTAFTVARKPSGV